MFRSHELHTHLKFVHAGGYERHFRLCTHALHEVFLVVTGVFVKGATILHLQRSS